MFYQLIRSSNGVVLRCLLDGCGFLYPASDDITIAELTDEIRRRHKIGRDDQFKLVYSFPRCNECFLDTQDDISMLFFAVKLYKIGVLDIVICKDIPSASSRSSRPMVSINSQVDEEQYLGSAFRTPNAKAFLSDEWAFYIKEVGQQFMGGINEFRDKVKKYAVQIGFDFFYYRNTDKYIGLECEDMDCCFFIKGSVNSADGIFYIQECELVHSCKVVIRRSRHRLLDSELVSSCIFNDVMYNLTIRPKEIISKFKLNYGFNISYKVALNARSKVIQHLFGKDAESFNKLIWYRDEVLSSNPGSVFELEVDSSTNRFKRVFVSYGGCIEGFKSCQPILYVDGCFGTSAYKGQILAATSKNGNQGIYPLAICICDSENEDNWNFFFSHLKSITDTICRPVTFVSERGLGLLAAFDKIYPGNPHLYCFFHLKNNLRNRYTGTGKTAFVNKVVNCFMKCAYSSSEKEYLLNLNKLRIAGGARIIDAFLKDLPLHTWCRAFAIGTRFGVMANSLSECFNSWIKLERAMPVYTLLEEVRIKQMELISSRRVEALSWSTQLTPTMEQRLEEEIDKGRRYRVISACSGLYEVRDVYSYKVNLNERTCSCIKWQINYFPCPHALAAIQHSANHSPYDFIESVFHVDMFRQCYDCAIFPVSNVDESFSEYGLPRVEVPVVKNQPGRRRKKRFKSIAEVHKKKTIACGRCKKRGNHNRLTCNEIIP